MKKNETRYSASKVISFAALLAMQTLPSSLHAQAATGQKPTTQADRAAKSNIYIKINGLKDGDNMKLVAASETACVFENSAGELFMVDGATGDMKPVSKADYSNMKNAEMKNGRIVFPKGYKTGSKDFTWKVSYAETLKVIGIDKDKHVVMQTTAGENVYLDPSTGDMVKCASGTHFKSAVL
jgi:hypothetical protein